jgi:GT2 family glycosyltransferase
MIKIAAILTVFNRKQKTLSCLEHLFAALDNYNNQDAKEGAVQLTIFLTDDGSTDDTAEAIRVALPEQDIHIIQGTGNLFWAGGMRYAWEEALKSNQKWDYFLLLNDDTTPHKNMFEELFEADDYCTKHYKRKGIYSGIISEPGNASVVTYGGSVFANKTKGRQIMLQPTGVPQQADMTNANILLIHHSVVDEIGIFYHGFLHACADYDYSMKACKKGFPVVVTSLICGECECDHDTQKEEILKLMNMSLNNRLKYVNSPIHSDRDHFLFVKRNLPFRYFQTLLMRTIRVYFPKLYYNITMVRGIYQ